MFAFLKKNFQPVFPKGFVDCHCHILPGIDDGAKNLKEAIDLILKLKDTGISKFIATPHVMEGVWENSSKTILNSHQTLIAGLKEHHITNVEISVAAEYMIDTNFINLIEKKDILPLAGNFVLVEMSYFNMPVYMYDVLFKMQLAGYKPVLAHPERYNFLHTNYNEYKKLKDAGCLFQLNLLSLSDYYGKKTKEIASKLLKDNFIDLVGTDTHHQKHLTYFENINFKKYQKILGPIFENSVALTTT